MDTCYDMLLTGEKFMKEKVNLLLSDKFIKFAFILSIVLFFVCSGLIFIIEPHMPPLIPIFNSMQWGAGRLFASQAIFFFPLIYIMVFAVNYFCSAYFYAAHPLVARILSLNAALVLFLGFLAYLQIVFLVL